MPGGPFGAAVDAPSLFAGAVFVFFGCPAFARACAAAWRTA